MTYLVPAEDHNSLAHYGIKRRSGRYPWGSGDNPAQRSGTFLNMVQSMRDEGMSDTNIAKTFDMTTTQLRATTTIARAEKKQADISRAQRLKDSGMSNIAIGNEMGINESSVRSLLAPGAADKAKILTATSDMLKEQVAEKGYIDIGTGVEGQIHLSKERLAAAVSVLEAEGYAVHKVQVDQLGTQNKTTIKVLAPPGTEYREIATNTDKIQQIQAFTENNGRSYGTIDPPLNISLDRVSVRYAEDGGADADGVIYVRPGVDDLAMGGARYAQVRIAVGGTHYLKGMAVYKDDLPDGVDLVFNTNKKNTGDKLKAMKSLKEDKATGEIDADNPFGAIVRQIKDPKTGKPSSALNIVNEEGDWDGWSKNLASQMLSKQSPALVRSQLDMTYERRKGELDDILALTNPEVRKKLLADFSESADSAAVHLKAAAMPRQASHVILPVNSLKDTEIYAPNYKNGERVVLVRYPHGGVFEIPELTVNNNHPAAKKLLGSAKDAVGINSKVAGKLSGADFDGDTVLVIPNNSNRVRTAPSLAGLKGFDPQSAYPAYEGMPKMKPQTKQTEMGKVSNLITDMTIRGANDQELARAVRHSMVVIDAEKHNLNYRQSAIDNGISQLTQKYQPTGGASTLISNSGNSTTTNVVKRKERAAKDGGPIDKTTGKKVYEAIGKEYVNKNGKTVVETTKIPRIMAVDDANKLSSGTPVEKLYADHSNRLRSLGDQARLAMVNTPPQRYSPTAKQTYSQEVRQLDSKLAQVVKNRPLERQAQVIANARVNAKRQANPNMDSADLKKLKSIELTKARNQTGAQRQLIQIEDREWEAIQAGAISANKLKQILQKADPDRVRELATPRQPTVMTGAKQARAEAMLRSGYTWAEIGEAMGVPTSTVKSSLG